MSTCDIAVPALGIVVLLAAVVVTRPVIVLLRALLAPLERLELSDVVLEDRVNVDRV